MYTLLDSGCVGNLRKTQKGIKITGDGAEWWNAKVDVEVSQISSSAEAAIRRTGGTINLVYYNRTGLRALLNPQKYGMNTPGKRDWPYFPPPRPRHLRRLDNPFGQPIQHPLWEEKQQLVKQHLDSEDVEATQKVFAEWAKAKRFAKRVRSQERAARIMKYWGITGIHRREIARRARRATKELLLKRKAKKRLSKALRKQRREVRALEANPVAEK